MSFNLKNKNVLVTGGSGFIGSNIVKRLLREDVNIRVVAHNKDFISDSEKIEVFKGDITDLNFCKNVVKDINVVFNCASFTSGSFDIVNHPTSFILPNLIINAQMLEASNFAGVEKFVFISSCTVYPERDTPQSEADAWKGDVQKSYESLGWLNRYIEKLSQFYNDNFDMDVCVVRASSTFGEGDNFNLITARVIPSLIRKIISSQDEIEVWGDGDCVRDFIYIDDLVDGIFLALKHYSCGRPINIASGVSHSVNDCIEKIFLLTGRKLNIVYNKNMPSTISGIHIDINLAMEKINFKPSHSFEEGIKKTIEWYNSNFGDNNVLDR